LISLARWAFPDVWNGFRGSLPTAVENDKLIWPHCAGLIWPHPGVGYCLAAPFLFRLVVSR
jgi:hypothetical protein